MLLGAALKMGAIIGGASKKDTEQLYEFGRNIGIAFQIKDDLLDVFGDTNKFGKQLGGDIIANKKTCLYLKAISLSDGEKKMDLVNLYSSETINPTEKVENVKHLYETLEIEQHINELINEFYDKAMLHLNTIQKDTTELKQFASQLKTRVS